jgi:CRP/FNR family transcriptional regulator, cyclic AMP receptor protein
MKLQKTPDPAEIAELLPSVSPMLIRQLTVGARSIAYGPREVVFHVGDVAGPALISAGLLRALVSSRKGREATVRYFGPGWLAGLLTLFKEMPITVVAVENSIVIHFDRRVVSRLAHEHTDFAWGLFGQCSELVVDLTAAVRMFAFNTVKQRVAAHILSFASQPDRLNQPRIARVTHQGLADSVGSVRVVVARAVRDLKSEGLVATVPPAGIVILDEAGLQRVADLQEMTA